MDKHPNNIPLNNGKVPSAATAGGGGVAKLERPKTLDLSKAKDIKYGFTPVRR